MESYALLTAQTQPIPESVLNANWEFTYTNRISYNMDAPPGYRAHPDSPDNFIENKLPSGASVSLGEAALKSAQQTLVELGFKPATEGPTLSLNDGDARRLHRAMYTHPYISAADWERKKSQDGKTLKAIYIPEDSLVATEVMISHHSFVTTGQPDSRPTPYCDNIRMGLARAGFEPEVVHTQETQGLGLTGQAAQRLDAMLTRTKQYSQRPGIKQSLLALSL